MGLQKKIDMDYFSCLLKLIAVSLFLVVIFIHCCHKYVEYDKYVSLLQVCWILE